MAGVIRRALGRLLGRASEAQENVRYVDFVEPSRPATDLVRAIESRSFTPGTPVLAQAKLDEPNVVPAPPVSGRRSELATAPAAPTPMHQGKLHPDDDWFAGLPETVATAITTSSSCSTPEAAWDWLDPDPFDPQTTENEQLQDYATLESALAVEIMAPLPGSSLIPEGSMACQGQNEPESDRQEKIEIDLSGGSEAEALDAERLPMRVDQIAQARQLVIEGQSTAGCEFLDRAISSPQVDLSLELLALIAREEEREVDERESGPEIDGDASLELDGEWLFEDELTEDRPLLAVSDVEVLPEWVPGDDGVAHALAVPYSEAPEESEAWRAGRRAAMLVNELGLERRSQQRQALHWLQELLKEFPHGASHAAVSRLVLGGIAFEELQTAAAIVRLWRSDSSLWLVRRYDGLQRQWQVATDRRGGRTGLAWGKAAQFAAGMALEEVAVLLTGEWRDEWLGLSPGDLGARTYAAYVSMKVERPNNGSSWKAGFELVASDGFGWLSKLDPELARAVSPDGRLSYHTSPGDMLAKGLPSERNKSDAPISR